ncbi:MAG: STAS domain-containing protein [Acutalibacteraceae bacterium]|jgi:anti-sigma B factor antagonist|nr:STAS domain-containing protein [Acutalibacteraceae bacterium]
MTIDITKNAYETTIRLAGRLDTITAPDLDKTINEDIKGTKNLVIDLKDIEYVSSAGLRVILAAQKKMDKVGAMKVTNVCQEVMEVFELTGFTDILVIA